MLTQANSTDACSASDEGWPNHGSCSALISELQSCVPRAGAEAHASAATHPAAQLSSWGRESTHGGHRSQRVWKFAVCSAPPCPNIPLHISEPDAGLPESGGTGVTLSRTRTAASRLRLGPPSKDPYKPQNEKRYLFFFSFFSYFSVYRISRNHLEEGKKMPVRFK